MNPLRVLRLMLHVLMLIVNALLVCFACAVVVDGAHAGHAVPPILVLALAVAACALVFVSFIRLGIHRRWEALSWVWFELSWCFIFGAMQFAVTLTMTVDRNDLCQMVVAMRPLTRDPVTGWPCEEFQILYSLYWLAALFMLLPCLVFGALALSRCRADPTIWEHDVSELKWSPSRSSMVGDLERAAPKYSQESGAEGKAVYNGETFYDIELGSHSTPHDADSSSRAVSIWSQLSGPFFQRTATRRAPIDRSLISKPLPYDETTTSSRRMEAHSDSNAIVASFPRVRYDRPLSLFGSREPESPTEGPLEPASSILPTIPEWARTASQKRGKVPAFPTKRTIYPLAANPSNTGDQQVPRPPSSVADYPPRPDAPEPQTPLSYIDLSPSTVTDRTISPLFDYFRWKLDHSATITDATTPRDVSMYSKASSFADRLRRETILPPFDFEDSRSRPVSEMSRYSKPSPPPPARTRY